MWVPWHIRSHNVRRQLDHPPERQGLPAPLAARVLSRGRQGQAPHDRQPLPLQGGGSGGDPARAPAQGGPGRDGRSGGREGAGVGPRSLGGGGLAVVATGPRPRHRRRPRLGSAGQAGAVASHRARSGPGLAPVGGAPGGRARGGRGARHDQLRRRRYWLAQHQADIETRLFAQRKPASAPDVFLYDVTSTYLEGEQNAFAAFGYNRDRKSGKRQIVIGLLCDADGRPLSIELFAGNTLDVKTFSSQLSKAAARFGAERVTFVGDRGMIKAPQRAELRAADFHYITAITKAQIDGLIAAGVLQMDLFEQTLAEVEGKDGERYVLRRNPARAEELAASRQDKLATLRTAGETANKYLREHPRAAAKTQLSKLKARAKTLHIDRFVQVAAEQRSVALTVDQEALTELARL